MTDLQGTVVSAIVPDMFDDKLRMRFWSKVNKDGPIPEAHPLLGPCWIWIPRGGAGGYGQMYVAGKQIYAHRLSYMIHFGEIPSGMVVDHRCEVRNCVRPDHLVAATQRDNVHRARSWEYGAAMQREKTHCVQGHPYSGDNLRVCKNGKRACRTCEREYTRQYRLRNPLPKNPKVPKTHCDNGHEFTEKNTHINKRGVRICRACKLAATYRYLAKKATPEA